MANAIAAGMKIGGVTGWIAAMAQAEAAALPFQKIVCSTLGKMSPEASAMSRLTIRLLLLWRLRLRK
jgi:hypothetical protein